MQFNRQTLKIAGIVVAAVMVILIALPLFINVNSFRPKIEPGLTNAPLGTARNVGRAEPFAFSGKLGVENVSIADDPAFSNSPFITAKSLKVGVELMPLIFSKKLNVTGIALDAPPETCSKPPTEPGAFSRLGGKCLSRSRPPHLS